MIRVLIADDHTIVRDGLKHLLAAAGDIDVIAEARNGQEVIEHIRSAVFDVLLTDLSMPGKSGIELIRQVHVERPKVRILVLSMHEEHQYAVRAIRAGAAGYMTKESATVQLVEAIRKIAAGGAFISAEVAQQLALGAMPNASGPLHETLSDREFQILLLIARGVSISDIAQQLFLSVKTVSTHKSNILHKMQMTTQTELIRYALSHHLLVQDS
jgi:DNA-binding NarL/FixJ family response regulator